MADDLAGRLNRARERAGRSIRSLQMELEAAGIDGCSYPNVHAYMKGKTTPSLDFLTAAGKALNVRPAWLAFGEEPESVADAPVQEASQPRGGDGVVADMTGGASGPLMVELLSKLMAAQPAGAPDLTDEDVSTAARAIQRHLVATWVSIAKSGEGGPGGSAGQFFILSLMAMLAAVPGAQKGRPLADFLSRLPQRITNGGT